MSASPDPYLTFTQRFFDRWVRWYDLFAAPLAPVYRRAALLAAPEAGGEILDLCTGTGQVAHRTLRRGARLTAGDITFSMLHRARRAERDRTGAHWIRLDARNLPFADGRFAVVTLSFALHDMPKPVREAVLREATRVSRRLIVVDYELPGGPFVSRSLRRIVELWESPWFRNFARIGLDQTLASTGWTIQERHRWPHLLAGLRVLEPPPQNLRP